MRKTLFVLFSLLIALGVMAQENAGPTKLTGRLVIEGSDKAVPNATITLVNQDISTISNLNGEFSFMYLEGGDDELIVEADGLSFKTIMSDLALCEPNTLMIASIGSLRVTGTPVPQL